MLARGGTYSVVGFGGMVSFPSAALVGNEHTVVGQPRRHLARPLGGPAAPRGRPADAEDRDAPAGLGERGAREAPRRRDHRPRRARSLGYGRLWVRSVAGAAVSIDAAALPRSR